MIKHMPLESHNGVVELGAKAHFHPTIGIQEYNIADTQGRHLVVQFLLLKIDSVPAVLVTVFRIFPNF